MGSLTISAVEAASLLRITPRAIRKACREGRMPTTMKEANGGPQYHIALDSLPPEAQYRYWAQQIKAHPPLDRRAALEKMNLDELAAREVARLAGVTRKQRPLAPLPPTPAESYAAQLAFEKRPASAQTEGRKRAQIMLGMAGLDAALPMMERYRLTVAGVREELGEEISIGTLRRWHQAIRHLPYAEWSKALAPDWCGGKPKAEFADEAWAYIYSEWAIQSQPALRPIYRRARREAAKQGWALPSYKTVLRRVNALPATTKAYVREGDAALDLLYPAMQRDYSTLRLHQMWVSDGRKADVFCVWPDGHVGRPILMAWQELRTRKVLGWAIGKVESAELTRLSFRDAAMRASAIPEEAYLDNGRAYAAKAITGGQTTRNRFKVNADDPHGLLTLFDIKAVWATPYRGQVKPIESYWNTIAQAERCAAFARSYCGNRPDAKPEEFDPRKLVPIAHYTAFARETIDDKNAQEHRGDSMDGRTPDDLYAELIATTPVRQPSAEQLRLCLLAIEQVRLDKGNGFTILGNRYWSHATAELAHRGPYTARYNAEDATESVALYEGSRFVGKAELVSQTGFRDTEAQKAHARAKNQFKRATKDAAKADASMRDAKRSWAVPIAEPGDALPPRDAKAPAPKVAQLVRVPQIPRPSVPPVPTRAQVAQSEREFQELLAKGLDDEAVTRRRAVAGL